MPNRNSRKRTRNCFGAAYDLSKLGQLETEDGTLTNDSRKKAEVLNTYFASVFEIEGQGALPEFQDRDFDETLTYVEITENLVAKTIDRLKPPKSQGPDETHPKLIKECKTSIVTPLTIIFKKVYKILNEIDMVNK